MAEKSDLNERYVRMTTHPVSRLIPQLAIPTIVTMLITALYNMADTFFVGKINTSATGAVGIVLSLMTIIQMVGMTLGIGSGSYVARLMGAKNGDKTGSVASTAFFSTILLGLCLTAAGELFLDDLMRALGSTETILPYARSYASIILLGAPFMAASFVMNVNLRSEGNAVLSMMGMASGAVLNIALDPIFIFVLDMGIAGAALATILSQAVGFMILLSHYLMKRSVLRIRLSSVSREISAYLEILKSGLPTLLRQSVMTLGAVALNTSAGMYGDAAVAGMSVVTRIMMFLGSAILGYGQGFQPIAAFNYSAGLLTRVRKAFWFAVFTGTAFSTFFAVLAGSFAPAVIRLFRDDPEVIRIGTFTLRMQCVSLPLFPYIVMANMMFQYIGKPIKASVLALSRQGIMFIPALLILSRLFGLAGIQASQAVADILTFLLAVPITAGTLMSFRNDSGVPCPPEVRVPNTGCD